MEESIVNDPVGLKAIQSIMQTATQSNLSFFHKAGTMSNSIISLSPSVQQLLDLSKIPTCKTFVAGQIEPTDIVDALSSTVDIYNKMIIWSPNIIGIIRIYCDEHQTMIKALSKLHLGIEGIHDLMISHDGNTITNGSNLGKLLKLPGIDPNQTYSNHLLEM